MLIYRALTFFVLSFISFFLIHLTTIAICYSLASTYLLLSSLEKSTRPITHIHGSPAVQYPMLFQLQNNQTRRETHCGVLEFSAEEGKMYMPYWMMNNLFLKPNDIVTVRSVSLPKATYTQLQPQENAFLKISNPK